MKANVFVLAENEEKNLSNDTPVIRLCVLSQEEKRNAYEDQTSL
jgi:hypothetical protein